MHALPIEVVGHVEGPETATANQRIDHEVDRPDPIRSLRYIQRYPLALG
jgi:hypothetical protein